MKIKTAELTGAALDWAVAKCEGFELYKDAVLAGTTKEGWWISGLSIDQNYWVALAMYEPSTDWAQGGPIIEREGGTLWSTVAAGWRCKAKYDYANDREGLTTSGPTLLIAAMRCYVASKLGDEVDVPEELLP